MTVPYLCHMDVHAVPEDEESAIEPYKCLTVAVKVRFPPFVLHCCNVHSLSAHDNVGAN